MTMLSSVTFILSERITDHEVTVTTLTFQDAYVVSLLKRFKCSFNKNFPVVTKMSCLNKTLFI